MTPASPSWPSFRNVAWTFIPIFTFSGLTSISCEVSRTPSSIWTIAITYGFCISNWAGASWMTVYVTTAPLPLRRTRSIFPTDRRPHVGQTALGGKSTFPQLPHFVPIRLYRLWISRQKRGTAISVPSLEDMDDGGCAGAAQGVRQPAARSNDLALSGLPAKLPHDLDRLRNAGSPDRLTAGLQAARGVDGNLAVQRGEAVRRRRAALPLLDEPEVLDREDLGDREVVVHLGDLHVLRLESGLLERALARRMQRAVLVILHRDRGHLFPGRVVLVHVTAGHHRVQARERRAEDGFPLLVRGGRQDLRGLDLADVRHLLRATDDHDVVHPGRDREARLQKRDRPARAAAFDPDRREVHVRQAGVIGDEGGHVLLVDELPRGHVPDVDRIDVLGPELRILDRLQPGLDAEVPERTVPEFSELRLADADYGDVPHRSGLPHQDLPAVLRVRRVIDEDLVRDHLLDRRRRVPAELRDLVGHGEVEAIGAGTAAVTDREDAIARLGLVQDRAEAHHDRAAVRVADVGDRTFRPDEEGGPSGRGAVLERVPRRALARVGTDREAVLHHLRQGQAHRRLHRGGPGLARELEVRGREDRGGTDRFRDDRRGGLDRVRVGLDRKSTRLNSSH